MVLRSFRWRKDQAQPQPRKIGRKSASLLEVDTSIEGVFVSAGRLKIFPRSSLSIETESSHSSSPAPTPPGSWLSAGSKDHHQGAPLIVRPLEAEELPIVDEAEALGLMLARSRQLPGTWYFSSNHIMVNEARVRRTIAPLVRLPQLDSMARKHAEAMAADEKMFHSDPRELGDSLGLQSRRLGENVARGSSVRDIHSGMMRTRAHKNNILDRRFTHMGMATAKGSDGKLYMCQIFRG